MENGASSDALNRFKGLVERAVAAGANDIHLVPEEQGYVIRFRIRDRLHDRETLSRLDAGALIRQLKTMAGLSIRKRSMPQEGVFSYPVERDDGAVRVSIVPGRRGEICVIKLFSAVEMPASLSCLGIPDEEIQRLRISMASSAGLTVVAGGSGSGKLATFALLLKEMTSTSTAVYVVSDRYEGEHAGSLFRIPGAHQVFVDEDGGADLRAILESMAYMDPDLVGITARLLRDDLELVLRLTTAGIKTMALTEEKSVQESLRRLQQTKFEHLEAALNCLTAQAQVRRLCTTCRRLVTIPTVRLVNAGLVSGCADETSVFSAEGCDACDGTGYDGAIHLIEVAPLTASLRAQLSMGMTPEAFKRAAVEAGMRSLRQWGLIKLAQGQTSLEEVLAATPDDGLPGTVH